MHFIRKIASTAYSNLRAQKIKLRRFRNKKNVLIGRMKEVFVFEIRHVIVLEHSNTGENMTKPRIYIAC